MARLCRGNFSIPAVPFDRSIPMMPWHPVVRSRCYWRSGRKASPWTCKKAAWRNPEAPLFDALKSGINPICEDLKKGSVTWTAVVFSRWKKLNTIQLLGRKTPCWATALYGASNRKLYGASERPLRFAKRWSSKAVPGDIWSSGRSGGTRNINSQPRRMKKVIQHPNDLKSAVDLMWMRNCEFGHGWFKWDPPSKIDPKRSEMPWYQLREGQSSEAWCSMISIGTGSQLNHLKTIASPQKDRKIEQLETMGTIPTWKHVSRFYLFAGYSLPKAPARQKALAGSACSAFERSVAMGQNGSNGTLETPWKICGVTWCLDWFPQGRSRRMVLVGKRWHGSMMFNPLLHKYPLTNIYWKLLYIYLSIYLSIYWNGIVSSCLVW